MSAALDPFTLPHREARGLFERGAQVYLPVNPVEYHGPHLSLHNDAVVSRRIARDLHARVGRPGSPLLVAADLEVGVDPCPGPGTRAVPFRTVVRVVAEACRALAEIGARRVVLVTFHGSPLHALALTEAARAASRAGVRCVAPFHEVLRLLVHADGFGDLEPAVRGIADAALRDEVLAGLPSDFHAGFFETSVSLHYAPDSVSPTHRDLPPCPRFEAPRAARRAADLARSLGRHDLAREIEFAALGNAWYALRPFPGYTSRPSLASAEAGAYFAERLVGVMAPVVEAVLERGEPGPRPVLSWVRALTLGGRLPAAHVPVRDVLAVS